MRVLHGSETEGRQSTRAQAPAELLQVILGNTLPHGGSPAVAAVRVAQQLPARVEVLRQGQRAAHGGGHAPHVAGAVVAVVLQPPLAWVARGG